MFQALRSFYQFFYLMLWLEGQIFSFVSIVNKFKFFHAYGYIQIVNINIDIFR